MCSRLTEGLRIVREIAEGKSMINCDNFRFSLANTVDLCY